MNPTDIHGMALALGLPSALAQIEAVKQLVADAVAAEREAFASHAVDIARRAVAEEREACAKVADDAADNIGPIEFDIGASIAASIRARGNA